MFGIPRQSGLVDSLEARVVFEPAYRSPEAVPGLEGFSHLWLIWQFSQCAGQGWSPTVRPPKLGGNARVGVFASRSPFRPNPIGLSSVRLERVETDPVLGPVLHVCGADLMDGTLILDIAPPGPIPTAIRRPGEALPEARKRRFLEVACVKGALDAIPPGKRQSPLDVLAQQDRWDTSTSRSACTACALPAGTCVSPWPTAY